MNHFNFNQHFKNFEKNIFFNEKTYADLKSDIISLSESLPDLDPIAIKTKSPYLTFVAILACFRKNKLAVLISQLETSSMIEKLRSQINFNFIIEDFHIERALTASQKHIPLVINTDHASIIVFSSGTTSLPKGVVLSFSNLYYSSLGFSEYFKQTEQEKSLITLPHHHVGGLMILWRSFFSGGSVVDTLTNSIDYLSLVPLQLKCLIDDKNALSYLKTIRVILIGGAQLNSHLKDEAYLHNLNIYETYGMTETSSLVMVNGEALPYREIKLDKHNFINVKGEIISPGYFENNQFTAITSPWLKTNDIGEVNICGEFLFKERADLIFVSGGENINPLLIEEISRKNLLIKDAYLVPIECEKWGKIGIFLYDTHNNEEISSETLNNFFKKKLHPHFIPKHSFKINLNLCGQLKEKRNELIKLAHGLYLKNIFSFDYHEIKDAPLIVFFHGFMGDKEDLKAISSSLKFHYSKLYIDLPGHGESKIENFHSFLDIFKKLSSFIELFSIKPIFYGYSMGGRIALHLALNFLTPKFLILESASLGLRDKNEQTNSQKKDFEQFLNLKQEDICNFLVSWYKHPIFENYNSFPIFESEIKKKCMHNFSEWRDSQKYFSKGYFPLLEDNIKQIAQKKFPLFYIHGELDLKYKNFAKILHSMNNSIYEIKDSGHNPNKTHPIEITEILLELLK